MESKKCGFDRPTEHKSSSGLHPGMFNQDVSFQFEVNVKTTDLKDVQAMLDLFNRTAASFNEAWKKL